MAMYRNLESTVKDTISEGVPVTAGLIGSSAIGLYVESYVNKNMPVTPDSSLVAKVTSAVANNLPKLLIYQGVSTIDKGATGRSIKSGILASVAFDSILRIASRGVNPLNVNFGGYRILDQGTNQKIIQENSLLRTELNKALQKMSYLPNETAERQRQFGVMPSTPDEMQRQRRYGAMPFDQATEKTSRERKYGFSAATENQAKNVFNMQ
jgi:hypothetical protein